MTNPAKLRDIAAMLNYPRRGVAEQIAPKTVDEMCSIVDQAIGKVGELHADLEDAELTLAEYRKSLDLTEAAVRLAGARLAEAIQFMQWVAGNARGQHADPLATLQDIAEQAQAALAKAGA